MGLLHFPDYIALGITTLFPTQQWYRAAYWMAYVLACRTGKTPVKHGNSFAIRHAIRLNSLLALMTRSGKHFPIPIQSTGSDLFLKPRPYGLILCSIHIPLSKVALRHLIEQNLSPTLALAAEPGPTQSIAVWGMTQRIPAVETGRHVLIKAKTVLQKGGTIVALVDHELGGPYSPNVFKLAERIQADIIYFEACLQSGGMVEVCFRESEWNHSSSEDRVLKQMEELRQHMAAILRKYGQTDYLTVSSPANGRLKSIHYPQQTFTN